MSSGVVIVGAGQAAGELAVRLRQLGYDRALTLIGAEGHLPYQRPPLSKDFLSGAMTHEALLLRPAETYAGLGIDTRLNTVVAGIDRLGKAIHTTGGEAIGYDALVLATGGRARRLDCPGADLANVFSLRTIDDVLAIRGVVQPGRRLVLVGGGYVGLEVAAVAIKSGLAVTVLEAAPRLLARVTGPQVSAFYRQAHEAAGVVVRTAANVVALHGDEAVREVELEGGERVAADLVIAGIGLIPSTELAAAAGLAVADGIVVDEYCRTEDPAILAIGDCCNHPSPYAGRRLRLESVPNVLEQARVAAATILGERSAYEAIPWFWSNQYDLKLQAVGLVQADDDLVLRGEMATRRFVAFYLRQGRLVAADAVNRAADFMAAKRLLAAGMTPTAAQLIDETVPLKVLLA